MTGANQNQRGKKLYNKEIFKNQDNRLGKNEAKIKGALFQVNSMSKNKKSRENIILNSLIVLQSKW